MLSIRPRSDNLLVLFGDKVGLVMKGIARAVDASLKKHPLRNQTDAAVQERVDFCLKTARELQREKQWPAQRIADEIGRALDARLNGNHWEPSARQVWVPADGL